MTVLGGRFYYLLTDQLELHVDRCHLLGPTVVECGNSPCSRSAQWLVTLLTAPKQLRKPRPASLRGCLWVAVCSLYPVLAQAAASEIGVKYLTLFEVRMRLLKPSLQRAPLFGLGDSCCLPDASSKVDRKTGESGDVSTLCSSSKCLLREPTVIS